VETAGAPRAPSLRGPHSGSALEGDFEAHALRALQMGDDVEQVLRLRIALRAEHPHQALRGDLRELAQALEPHRAVDVVAQQRLAGVEIASEPT